MYLQNLIAEVNKTHTGLGELIAVCQLVVTARKMLLIVSPSGCGKSRAMDYVAKAFSTNTWRPDSVSRAGLGVKADQLKDFQGVIVVDDLSTTQTPYARASTLSTLVALTYTHRVESDMLNSTYVIENFYGSALVGIQPVIERELLLAPEWEGTIKDKVLRYYHLHRPVVPNLHPPDVALQRATIDNVDEHEPDTTNPLWQKLVQLGLMQFSRARTKEHLLDYLRASAALDGRRQVESSDYELLEYLFRPLAFEVISVTKDELEGQRELNNNLLALLTEYYTYGGQFSLAQVAIDYQITIQQCYRIMRGEHIYWDEINKSPTIFRPSKMLSTLLKKYDLEVK